MRFATRTSLIVALVAGLIAVFLVRGVLLNIAASSDAAGRSVTIVMTRQPVAFGAPLTADNLREVPWRTADPLEGSFATIRDVLKDGRRLALVSLQRNEPVLANRITAANQRATLSTQIDQGMRAVTIRVDEVRGVAGFVLPGDRVDVILTRGEGAGQEVAAYADVLLQSAKVLAVDQLSDERQDKPAIARAVTLELTGQQAQKVILAQGIGRLSLALRQANGAVEDDAVRVTADDLGLSQGTSRDRLADIEAKLGAIATSAEAAGKVADRKLSEFEAQMRGEMLRAPAQSSPMATPPQGRPAFSGSVVTVTRNGSKTESYNVASER
ncbi:Flp pilus assembly protein CpaB [uncultured Enterovirga sp.]|uniref:Flp pilus assembly protein CpaB n=1 Tax=uncultured Enterovirga sp. TaxID=2026352 RepID=UPI0035CAC7BB